LGQEKLDPRTSLEQTLDGACVSMSLEQQLSGINRIVDGDAIDQMSRGRTVSYLYQKSSQLYTSYVICLSPLSKSEC